MTELERVRDAEVVEDGPSWDQIGDAWDEGGTHELIGQLKQCRAAASLARHYGQGSMEKFAEEKKCSKSKVYNYARTWAKFGRKIENGEISSWEESLNISQLIEATYWPDPIKALKRAHDDNKSGRELEGERRDLQQVEAEEEHGKAETIKTPECPACGALPDHWQRPPRGAQ